MSPARNALSLVRWATADLRLLKKWRNKVPEARKMDLQEACRMVTSAQIQATRDILEEDPSFASLQALSRNALGWAVDMTAKAPRGRVVCGPGCAWCCYLLVSATVAEVVMIVTSLRRSLDTEELEALKERVKYAHEATAVMGSWQRLKAGIPCPLLVGDSCSVHSMRPLVCAGWNSENALECQTSLNTGSAITSNVWQYTCHHAVLKGVVQGLEACGLESGLVELIEALHIGLNTPNLVERFFAGERLFASAYVTTDQATRTTSRMPAPHPE